MKCSLKKKIQKPNVFFVSLENLLHSSNSSHKPLQSCCTTELRRNDRYWIKEIPLFLFQLSMRPFVLVPMAKVAEPVPLLLSIR
jgi:hypothetical protein